ncbi:MAG: HEAT repeat domain-containing protein, partial [Verrucomicrobiota bacterium]
MLKDPDPGVRAEAAYLCARHDPETAWPVVKALSEKPDPELASSLSRGLARIGTEAALQRLEELYTAVSKNQDRGFQVIEGLGQGDERAIPLLIRLVSLHGAGEKARTLGQRILAEIDKEKVAAQLESIFTSGDRERYDVAAFFAAAVCPSEALEDVIAAALKKEPDLSSEATGSCLDALVRLNPNRHRTLFEGFLKHGNDQVRAMAVRCRALCEPEQLFDIFRPMVLDKSKPVTLSAMNSLSFVPLAFGPAEGMVAYLKTPLSSSDRDVLLTGLNLLGNRTSAEEFDKALDHLRPYLEGGQDEFRTRSASTLAGIGGFEKYGIIAEAQGYIGRWKVLGPFLNDKENTGFNQVYVPEKEIDFDKAYNVELIWDLSGNKRNEKTDVQRAEITWQEVQVSKETGSF